MNSENSLFELPRQPPPPCSANVKQVRFIGPKPSGDLELSTFELPRSPLVYTAVPVTNPLKSTRQISTLTINQSSQTDTIKLPITVNQGSQTEVENNHSEPNHAFDELLTIIKRQDEKLESLHDKLELLLNRIEEKKECSCNIVSESVIPTISPPALDNVLGQVEIMLNSPRIPMMRNDLAIPKVDQSAAFDALAMKYLRNEEVNKTIKPKRDTDLSLATAAYLQRHRLPH